MSIPNSYELQERLGRRKGERGGQKGILGDDDGEARRDGFLGGNTHNGVASFEFKRLRLYTFL